MEVRKLSLKNENNELAKHCDPTSYEAGWIKYWEENGIFSNHPSAGDPYSIVIPPPNVTGSLHMGHGLNNTLQDVLIRYNQLMGRDALWVPGMDHAGIATQNVVEKQLREENLTRHDLGREEFVKHVWDWKDISHDRIKSQLVRLGTGVDWTRERFTLDDQCSLAVRTAFKKLFDEGLIYKGHRMINWCPRCTTALSDIEVEAEEIEGAFYHIKYQVEGEEDFIEIATTRPETMLGDSAVAVHPEDERYKKYHGKFCVLPLVGRKIPIILDEYVDREFGTGALKVTPCHDPNDFELGQKHGLESFIMMDGEGNITEDYQAYAGINRFDAREKIVEDLKTANLLIKKVAHLHAVGHCQRCSSIVEPLVSNQWFVKMKELAGPAIQAVHDGRTRFVPERWTKVYLDWLENIQDWCISRQLWWGHRIPVWDCEDCGVRECSIEPLDTCPKCGSKNFVQQEDVLDTWFSSGLWPLSTLGWPDKEVDLKRYYPTSVLVTGFDIIFFWVARMMFFGMKFGGDVPFKDVFIHGIVRDEKGRKMSKSFGNVIDPLQIIDEHGADALRFTFLYSGSMGQDVSVSDAKVRSGRAFCDKLWNVTRFLLIAAPEPLDTSIEDLKPEQLDFTDRWIISRGHVLCSQLVPLMENYDLNEALQNIYSFIWHDFCDWYVELAKKSLYGEDGEKKNTTKVILHRLLEMSLVMLHPFMPFITEELWKNLPGTSGSIMQTKYPSFKWNEDIEAIEQMEIIKEVVRTLRDTSAKAQKQVKAAGAKVCFRGAGDKPGILLKHAGYISELSGWEVKESESELGADITVVKIFEDLEAVYPFGEQTLEQELLRLREELRNSEPKSPNGVIRRKEKAQDENGEPVSRIVEEVVEFKNGLDEELFRIRKKEDSLEMEMAKTEGKLGSEKFVARAPQDVIEKEKKKLQEFRDELEELRSRLNILAV